MPKLGLQISKNFPGALVGELEFGNSKKKYFEIEQKTLLNICEYLKNNSEIQMDILEFYSVFQKNQNLILTLFLRSSHYCEQTMIRFSLSLKDAAPVLSIGKIWKNARFFEEEISDLFGVRFENTDGTETHSLGEFLGDSKQPPPLREVR